MAKVYVFLADGLEEVEAITPVDVLRRAGNEVITVSIMGRKWIRGSHKIYLEADRMLQEVKCEDGDLFVLPGGGEGTKNLGACRELIQILQAAYISGKHVAAICAAPSIFGKLGFLESREATVYPGMEDTLTGATYQDVPVVTDDNVTTGHGPGAAFDFAFELVRIMNGAEAAAQLKKQMVFQHDTIV
ncbi:MAG: DJ-1 family glyoxalase III [Bilifractor sp.]